MVKYLDAVIESGEAEHLQPKDLYEKYKEFRSMPLKKFRDWLYRAREPSDCKRKGVCLTHTVEASYH